MRKKKENKTVVFKQCSNIFTAKKDMKVIKVIIFVKRAEKWRVIKIIEPINCFKKKWGIPNFEISID